MRRAAVKLVLIAIMSCAALVTIGVVAYHLGQDGRLALTLDGIDGDSRFGITWKAVVGGVFLTWFLEHSRRRSRR